MPIRARYRGLEDKSANKRGMPTFYRRQVILGVY